MPSQYDSIRIDEKMGGSFRHHLDEISWIMDGSSVDPLGRTPVAVISAGTPCAPVPATGKMKPIRYTLATAITVDSGSGGSDEVQVADPAMFQVGDVIGVVPQAEPWNSATQLGTIASIDGSILTLAEVAAAGVAEGDIIVATENDGVADGCILFQMVSLYNQLLGIAAGTPPVTVDTPGTFVARGDIDESQLTFNSVLGVTVTRLRMMLPNMYIVPPVAGSA